MAHLCCVVGRLLEPRCWAASQCSSCACCTAFAFAFNLNGSRNPAPGGNLPFTHFFLLLPLTTGLRGGDPGRLVSATELFD